MKPQEETEKRERVQGREYLRYEKEQVQGECIIYDICPLKFNKLKFVLFCILNVFIFIPFLLILWYPELKRVFYYDFCSYNESDHFYILNYDESVTICKKQRKTIHKTETTSKDYDYFINRYMTYIIDDDGAVRVSMFNFKNRVASIMGGAGGLAEAQTVGLRDTYGQGTMIIESPSCFYLFFNEILKPLYLFLLFSVCLWIFAEEYYYYSGVLIFITAVGLIINLYQMVKVNQEIFHMAYWTTNVNVLRDGAVKQIDSLDLVPGDIVFLLDPIKVPFEGVVLEGSVLMNECSLTGESVPIVKKADTIENMANPIQNIDKNSLIFEGTEIVQVNYKKRMTKFEQYREKFGIPVCVARTNFITTKGQLVRIILFPKEQENKFQKQSTKFIFFLFLIAVITFGVLIGLISQYITAEDGIIKFLDLVAITVPPSLPVSMTLGIIYALQKMKKKQIFCISQNKVITGGTIQFCCFDKTGTLTESFMDFECLLPCENKKFASKIMNHPQSMKKMIEDAKTKKNLVSALNNMAANHSIIKIEKDGTLKGDPMEQKLFLAGEFELNQSHPDPEVIFCFESARGHKGQIYRRFEFDSDVQRMSVICKNSLEDSPYIYSKGSPEMMLTIMDRSTVPSDYEQALKQYAAHGFRVLAIASAKVTGDIKTISRVDVEKNLRFDGFEVFENKLKGASKAAIKQLRDAEIGTVMITGDNSLTGSNISYKCGISDVNKGMFICDFDKGVFTEQVFTYNPHQDQDDTQNGKDQQKLKQQESNKKLIAPVSDRDRGKQVQIQLATKDNLDDRIGDNRIGNNSTSFQKNSLDSVSIQYMKAMISKADAANSQLCLTGRAFNEVFPGVITQVSPLQKEFISRISVYCRTKPNDKAKIVTVYQHMGLSTSMCGDGANDCGALKQADIGLSLSPAEASISAPFTSKIEDISSMVELIKECRAGLATNFSLFNIMAIYALIQYTTTVVTQKFIGYPGGFEYLYWDLICNFCFILFIGNTGTADKLSVDRPRSSLFAITNLAQVVIMFALQALGQIMVIVAYSNAFNIDNYYYLNGGMETNIQAYIDNEGFLTSSPEVDSLFYFVCPLYTFCELAFNISTPWRKPFYTNPLLMIVVCLTIIYSTLMILYSDATWNQFEIYYMPFMSFRGFVCGLSYAFGIFMYVNQKCILEPFSAYLIKKYPQKKWL